MPRERLHQALTTLQEELRADAPVSEADRALLRELAGDVDRLLDDASLGAHLKERAEAMAAEFEAEHPQLAGVFKEVVGALARMGI